VIQDSPPTDISLQGLTGQAIRDAREDAMVERDTGEALDAVEELVQRGDGRMSLTDAITLARSLGVAARLLSGTDRVRVEHFVILGTSDPAPMVVLRRAGERGGELLEKRQEVDADEWEYVAVEEVLQPTLWLKLTGGIPERTERVRLAAHEFALLDAHGWREDWADLLAEPRVWVATLLAGLARVFRLDVPGLDEADMASARSRKSVARRAGELLQRKLRANDANAV
jgi:hypothetical protein